MRTFPFLDLVHLSLLVLVITASIHFDIDEFAKLMVGFRSEGAGGRVAAKEDVLEGAHLFPLLKVRSKMALLMAMVGWNMCSGGAMVSMTTCAWFPLTMKRGKRMEKTQPETTTLSDMLVRTARGKPKPRK